MKRFGFGLGVAALLIGAPSLVWGARVSSATYRAVFMGTWTAESHPTGFPSGSHFSPIVGATHNAEVSFWKRGEIASPGIEMMAETGATGTLRTEVETQIGMGRALAVIRKNPPRQGNTGEVTITFEFSVNSDFPLVTLTTMIAPSPDWFVGVSGLSLQDDQGAWVSSRSVELFPYDAGTEDGDMFVFNNPDTTPRGNIMSVRGVAPFSDEPMATLRFERLHQEEFHAELEQPTQGQLAAGVGLIRGWAFGSSEIDLELLVNGQPSVGVIPIGSERSDVEENFPNAVRALASGFGLTMNYGTLDPGQHALTVRGTSEMGAQFSITRQIMVKQFGGFEFADGVMLSGATVRLEGETIVIDGAMVSQEDPAMDRTQTISLRWSKAAQGFVVTDIMDQ